MTYIVDPLVHQEKPAIQTYMIELVIKLMEGSCENNLVFELAENILRYGFRGYPREFCLQNGHGKLISLFYHYPIINLVTSNSYRFSFSLIPSLQLGNRLNKCDETFVNVKAHEKLNHRAYLFYAHPTCHFISRGGLLPVE